MKVIKDTVYPEMYRIKFSGTELSDMYNLTRAKNHLAVIKENEARDKRRMPGIGLRRHRTCV